MLDGPRLESNMAAVRVTTGETQRPPEMAP